MTETLPNTFQCFNLYIDRALQHFTEGETKIMWFAIRHIFGWQDRIASKQADISLSMFEHGYTDENGNHYGGTGLGRAAIITACNNLVEFKFLQKVGDPTEKGQRWEITNGNIQWAKLEARTTEKFAKQKERTAKATTASLNKRTGTSDVLRIVTSDVLASEGGEGGTSHDTMLGTYDVQNQTHLQTHNTNTNSNTNTPHTPAPIGLGSGATPTNPDDKSGLKDFYATLEEKTAEADAVVDAKDAAPKPVETVVEEKSEPVGQVTTPTNPPVPPAPPTAETFDMTHLADVVANRWFEFNNPKHLLTASERTKRRMNIVKDIIADTFPDVTDERHAFAALEFAKYWATKKDKATGQPLSMPLNADSFGNAWRKWLNEHPDITRQVSGVYAPEQKPAPTFEDYLDEPLELVSLKPLSREEILRQRYPRFVANLEAKEKQS